MAEKLLKHESEEASAGGVVRGEKSRVSLAMVLQQSARGGIHMLQFSVSYCIMLCFMYSNGEITYLMFVLKLSKSKILIMRRIHYNVRPARCSCWLCLIHERHCAFAQ